MPPKKKLAAVINLQIQAGATSPTPPVGVAQVLPVVFGQVARDMPMAHSHHLAHADVRQATGVLLEALRTGSPPVTDSADVSSSSTMPLTTKLPPTGCHRAHLQVIQNFVTDNKTDIGVVHG